MTPNPQSALRVQWRRKPASAAVAPRSSLPALLFFTKSPRKRAPGPQGARPWRRVHLRCPVLDIGNAFVVIKAESGAVRVRLVGRPATLVALMWARDGARFGRASPRSWGGPSGCQGIGSREPSRPTKPPLYTDLAPFFFSTNHASMFARHRFSVLVLFCNPQIIRRMQAMRALLRLAGS